VNAVEAIAVAAEATGYRSEAVVRRYTFADVLNPAAMTREVPLVAFTQTPPSYRSAALAVVESGGRDALTLVHENRALGAPLLFVVDGQDVTVWQVRSSDPPRVLERLTVDEVPALFERNREIWRPDAIHRAKSVGATEKGYQLDFIDIGLLPAIEGEIHAKLDRLLAEALAAATAVPGADDLDMRLLFRVVFRLLAAKVLQDRGHPYAKKWNSDDLGSVLDAIESYYSLATMPLAKRQVLPVAFKAAWDLLRQGISFSNISSDDLAFVYENTLVTPEARALFGTHSTPRQVAEYVVARLELHRHQPESLSIYEPFAGAGVFLVSALRHLRDLLPVDWTDQKRHNFLVQHLAGDEIDPFACEVATLSLILADYPNHNGWHIRESDLFQGDTLFTRMRSHNVILCNPPFEAFNVDERSRYEIATQNYSKPMAVLDAALDAHPLALGFVLPRPFIMERQFVTQRRRIEQLYGDVELVELPDRVFGASVIESAVLIARDPRPPAPNLIRLRSTEIVDRDRMRFLKTGETTVQRDLVRTVSNQTDGDLWIPSLASIWQYLEEFPRVGDCLGVHRGIEWKSAQDEAWSNQRRAGYRRGLHSARNARQFILPQPIWIDCRPERLLYKAIDLPWSKPKLVVNAGRLSRGPWRIAASVDKTGLICSQQYFGLWPHTNLEAVNLLALEAVLNGPLANAFLAVHSPANRLRASAVERIPIPPTLPAHLAEFVSEYVSLLSSPQLMRDDNERLNLLLIGIDAAVLEAYDLPPRLERELLNYFRDAERPVAHPWKHWDINSPARGLRLAERVSARFRPHGNWIAEVFRPLPEREAALLREFGE
jgi:hypothetical protein